MLIEHLEGPSLRSLIKRGGALPLEQALPLCAHVAAALHYMAEVGFLHLDVKPDNIIMGVPPRLIDLSIATPLAEAAELRGALGTDAYMPPEQCDPEGHPGEISPASDVWGLGATLYHAVVGEVPFPRERGAGSSERSARALATARARGRAAPARRIPEALRALIDAHARARGGRPPGGRRGRARARAARRRAAAQARVRALRHALRGS